VLHVSNFAIKPTCRGGSPDQSFYGCAIAVGTRHGKEHQLTSAFDEILGARLVVPADLDTDQYGTFSGEVARSASALDAARAKAGLGMHAAGLSRGLASEASYGPLGVGWSLHEEILLYVDDVDGFEVQETHRAATPSMGSYQVQSIGELPAAVIATVVKQALIVRPATAGGSIAIAKGITDVDVLRTAVAAAVRASSEGSAVVEPDLRAHHNPARQQVLKRLAHRLARRLATRCPSCRGPGYGRVDVEHGLPCRDCSSPTALPRNEIHACAVCPHRETVPVARDRATPGACPRCNP
jgi:hypothetical protein